MHAHTTITPFMHDLDIACKNVLISHSMHMLAALVTLYKVLKFLLTLAKEPHDSDDFTSLIHHFNTPRTRMHSPDQCSILCLFTHRPTPNPFCQFILWVVAEKGASGHTKYAYTRTTYVYDYGVTCISVLHLHVYSK